MSHDKIGSPMHAQGTTIPGLALADVYTKLQEGIEIQEEHDAEVQWDASGNLEQKHLSMKAKENIKLVFVGPDGPMEELSLAPLSVQVAERLRMDWRWRQILSMGRE